MNAEEFQQRLGELKPTLLRVQSAIKIMLTNALEEERIDVVSLNCRIKSPESAFQKYQSKSYPDPFVDCTDLLGIRIVVYLESDVDRVAGVIRRLLKIDERNCVDHRKFVNPENVGYRSLHIVASLGEHRRDLPEYRGLHSIRFEIQIRTALQHTWAAIEHKRNYKGQHSLPAELQHRLMILAGTLELIDREFSQISREAEEYVESVLRSDRQSLSDDLSYVAMNSIVANELEKINIGGELKPSSPEGLANLVEELTDFGVATVNDFAQLVRSTLQRLASVMDDWPRQNLVSIVRHMMILSDPRKYFDLAYKGRFHTMDTRTLKRLTAALGNNDLMQIVEEFGLQIV